MANIEISTLTRNNDGNTYIIKDANAIPKTGSNQISGDLIPATDNSIDVGSSTKNIKTLYTKGITIDGAQFLPSDYVPRSGGAVLTGSTLGRDANNSEFRLDGGTGWAQGASISICGKDIADTDTDKRGVIILWLADGSKSRDMRIYPTGTWTWNGSACQIISDQRLKQQISQIDDDLLTAWEDVELSQFKYNDAVEEKSDNARLHTGYVVQQIDEACKSHNVDISKYGLYCHEVYQEETREVEHEDGTKTVEVVRPANEHYSLRYTECYAVECAYLRMKNKELQAQLDNLFNMVGKLTEKVGKLEGKLQ